ncbi:response regulator [Fictibacillus enclensis]|uniref:response regulator transcription factor n=1 Tax=Fictibacillus enclensis TaxID=1017270 RepID=UPI0025A1E77E|nr:response regulator [Fictibacillus enclensis]MDM5196667.1 response regulator [Fictibacillus enclensis]
MKTRIIVIDDELFVRKGIITGVDWDKYDIEIAGEAADGVSGLSLIKKEQPHIVVTDIRMPRMNGMDMIKECKVLYPSIKILVLSVLEDYGTLRKAIQLGVDDYIHKLTHPDDLINVLLKMKENLPKEPAGNYYKKDKKSIMAIEGLESQPTFISGDIWKRYQNALEGNDEQSAMDLFHKIFPEELHQAKELSAVKSEVCQWASQCIQFVKEWGGNPHLFQNAYEEILQKESYPSLKEWCMGLHSVLWEMLQELKGGPKRAEIEKAKEYIHLHYMDHIKIPDIAKNIGLSETYFSFLFTKETGKTFITYLQEKRVEEAKQLLRKRMLPWVQVGEKVGFENPKYFAKVFKKHIGMTPVQYQGK